MEKMIQDDVRYRNALRTVSEDESIQEGLVSCGFFTPFHITRMARGHFVSVVADNLGIHREEALSTYQRAYKASQKAIHLYLNLKTTIGSACFSSLRMGDTTEQMQQYFADMPSFQELFGSLAYHEDDAANTIFGVTAYYVDLLRMIDTYITEPNTDIAKDMTFFSRRPDLARIPLTREWAEKSVSYLQIVNERLEEAVCMQLSTKEPERLLATMCYPVNLPVNLPLEEIRAILLENGVPLSRVYREIGLDETAAVRERFHMTADRIETVSTPIPSAALPAWYGVEDLSELSDLERFLHATEMQRKDVVALIQQDLPPEERDAATLFFINRGKAADAVIGISDDRLTNLDETALDRIRRFSLVSGALGLASDRLDWLIRILSPTLEMDEAFLCHAFTLLDRYTNSGLEFYDLASCFGPLKTYGENCPFDRVYNRGDRRYHPAGGLAKHYTDAVMHWDIAADADTAGWLSGSLRISMDELDHLTRYLFPQTVLPLTVENLSALYRHSMLAKRLSGDMSRYVIAARLCTIGAEFFGDDLDRLLRLHKKLSTYKINIYDMDFLISGTGSAYVNIRYNEDSKQSFLRSLWAQPEGVEESAETVVRHSLATFFGVEEQAMDAVIGFFPPSPTGITWYDAFLSKPETADASAPYQLYIDSALLSANRWLNVLDNKVPNELLASISAKPGVYGFSAFPEVAIDNALTLYDFNAYFTAYQDDNHQLLDCVVMDDVSAGKLAEVTGWNEERIRKLLPILSGTVVDRMDTLQAYFGCAQALHAGDGLLQKLLTLKNARTGDYDATVNVRDSLSALMPDSTARDMVKGIKRSLYLSILCWKRNCGREDLFKYLLIDIEMDDKTQITYIREGINAAQMYLQRCRMGLELGVQEMEIEDTWWPWITSYTQWEANREIFVYPENYLLPSIRHTKTKPFQNVESGLQQSGISDAYISSLLHQYVDELSAAVEVKIVAAYRSGNVLYLFSHTKQQPYTYYYCQQQNGLAWSEWKKINATIASDQVTPVRVFNRLHLFWVETAVQTTTAVDQGQQEVRTWRADVKYIYLNAQQQWTPPQDLIKDEVLLYEDGGASPITQSALYQGLQQMDSPLWKRVSVFPVTGDSFAPYQEKQESFERLCVLFGPQLNTVAGSLTLPNIPEKATTDQRAFLSRIREQISRHNNMLEQHKNGSHFAGFCRVYNASMQEDFLFRPNEYILLEEYTSQNGFQPVVTRCASSGGGLGFCLSATPLSDMFSEPTAVLQDEAVPIDGLCFMCGEIDPTVSNRIYQILTNERIIDNSSRTSPAHVDPDALAKSDLRRLLIEENDLFGDKTELLLHIRNVLYRNVQSTMLFHAGVHGDARLIPVFNQIGAWIIDSRDETFLVQTVQDGKNTSFYPCVSDRLSVSTTAVTGSVLRSAGYSKEQSIQLLQQLADAGLLDERGFVFADRCTLEAVKAAIKDSGDLAKHVHSIVQNDPVVSSDVFVSQDEGINSELSKSIWDVFAAKKIVVGGRVHMADLYKYNPRDLFYSMLERKLLTNRQLDYIYTTLNLAPVPIQLRFDGKADAGGVLYQITRLSNGATTGIRARLEGGGVSSLLDVHTQNHRVVPVWPLSRFAISSHDRILKPSAEDGADVDFEGLYGEYYWELFYHIPLLVTDALRANNRQDLAREWFHYVFNPSSNEAVMEAATFYKEAPAYFSMTVSEQIYRALLSAGVIDSSGRVVPGFDDLSCLDHVIAADSVPLVRNILHNYLLVPQNAYYWNFFPFRQHKPEEMLAVLSDSNPAVAVYNDDPFDPHAIARLRIGAYEKYTVIQYIQNLIDWGDRSFSGNTWETLSTATLLYTVASELLGSKPVDKGAAPARTPVSYSDIRAKYGQDIPQFLIDMAAALDSRDDDVEWTLHTPVMEISSYFTIPENTTLLQLWDVVEDRLYKLRNSLDINGNPRTTPLYESTVDPMSIAKAAASSPGSLSPLPASAKDLYPYRFTYLIEQAKALANRLISVGAQLLSVLEKKDAEEFLYVTNQNESSLLDLTTQVKESQLAELSKSVGALSCSLAGAQAKHDHFDKLISTGLSDAENTSLDAAEAAFALGIVANAMRLAAGAAHAVPQIGSPFAMTYGGVQVGSMLNSIAGGLEIGVSISHFISQRSSTMAGYQRREEDWRIQRTQFSHDIQNIGKQMESLRERIAGATRELEIHKRNIELKQQMLSFLRGKFTGSQLYQWMLGRLNTVMWQTYQFAMELALKAQAAYQWERNSNSTFVAYQYWDSVKKGLLSGESLLTALDQMEIAFWKTNTRSLEIEKHVSLALNCPQALLDLKTKGTCTFDLTEALYDYDYPGGYNRRIVSVSVSIPALVGPYQSLRAVLTQTKHAIVTAPDIKGARYLLSGDGGEAPPSVLLQYPADQRIALSKGVDDSGVFNLNFGDERYLPFEGAGAVSSWRLDMPKSTNRFDFQTISDVIVHIKYRASHSEKFGQDVVDALTEYPVRGSLYYNLRQNFPAQWQSFFGGPAEKGQCLTLPLHPSCPYIQSPAITGVLLRLDCHGGASDRKGNFLTLTSPDGKAVAIPVVRDLGEAPVEMGMEDAQANWMLSLDPAMLHGSDYQFLLDSNGRIDADKLRNMELMLVYEGHFLE